ncbi:cytochrome d ubiquinol oxidase subunit II, partial [Vibrio cholerae]|nr:cytochrome d ubiquinol oxidase subunit II [Vibrio cholerae]
MRIRKRNRILKAMIHLIRRMSMLSLNELWFIIIAILFVGFFVLEGFDFGVGIVSRFLGENDL